MKMHKNSLLQKGLVVAAGLAAAMSGICFSRVLSSRADGERVFNEKFMKPIYSSSSAPGDDSDVTPANPSALDSGPLVDNSRKEDQHLFKPTLALKFRQARNNIFFDKDEYVSTALIEHPLLIADLKDELVSLPPSHCQDLLEDPPVEVLSRMGAIDFLEAVISTRPSLHEAQEAADALVAVIENSACVNCDESMKRLQLGDRVDALRALARTNKNLALRTLQKAVPGSERRYFRRAVTFGLMDNGLTFPDADQIVARVLP